MINLEILALVDPVNGRLEGYVKKLVSIEELKAISNPLRFKILQLLSEEPSYPLELARRLKAGEQLVYYHISQLKKQGLIKEIDTVRKRGIYATRYGLDVDGFVIMYRKDPHGGYVAKPPSPVFNQIFEKDRPVYLILSSPEPHGPFRSRGRDHYLAAQLSFLLGASYGNRTRFEVVLDTQMDVDLTNANLIVFGGPAVNMFTASVNDELPVYFDIRKDNAIISRLSMKMYNDDNCGLIELVKNPRGDGKMLLIAGKHLSGTKASMTALLNKPLEVARPNMYDKATIAHVVEGIDGDGDGEIDDAVILE